MLGNVKVGVKLTCGFLAVAALAAIIGIMGITSVGKMNDMAEDMYNNSLRGVSFSKELNIHLLYIGRATRNMIIYDDPAVVAEQYALIAAHIAEFSKILDSVEHISAQKEKDFIKRIRANSDEYFEFVDRAAVLAKAVKSETKPEIQDALSNTRGIGDMLDRMLSDLANVNDKFALDAHIKAEADYNSISAALIAMLVICLIIGIVLGVFLARHISGPVQAISKMLSEWSLGHLEMRLNIKDRSDEIGIMAKAADGFADDLQHVIFKWLSKISKGELDMEIVPRNNTDEIGATFKDLLFHLREIIIEDGGKVLQAAANRDLSLRMEGNYSGAFATMKNNINAVVHCLDDALGHVAEAVDQVSSASHQISSGAQSLAEGANHQASAIQEVSSSLEQMSSMTKQNADNSKQGKILVSNAAESLEHADGAMKQMGEAILAIKTSSDNTAKILKTIDDLAFQTNLLALNAAVEAARAGEAGKGFAVVAEEVRTLAMRSAEASKNTAEMIEESIRSAEIGVKITKDIAKDLNTAVQRFDKVNDIIAEIAAASNEQAIGIEQVNSAVAQLNNITQQNAANSEESASAAEELSSQAAELSNMVKGFTLSATSNSGKHHRHSHLKPITKLSAQIRGMPNMRNGDTRATAITKTVRLVKPGDIIPLDDEFSEF